MGTLLSSSWIDPIGCLNNFEPVIPHDIGIVAGIHTFVDVHPTFHTVWLQSFHHCLKLKHLIVQRHHHRLHGTDGLVRRQGTVRSWPLSHLSSTDCGGVRANPKPDEF
mmetsp:Transcript_10357/g.10439  ORF Transcript_10357/g.10439 Transcript_10357/m.10439 type:complete len:108 (-) Transcript_10357:73-396(-)